LNYYNYFTEIEETFVRRRGKHLLLSPIDWAMIEGWQERGVPLHVVIRGIETVFDAYDKKPSNRSIKGLLYCREEIEAQYAEWLAMQAGNGANALTADSKISREDIADQIDAVLGRLRETEEGPLREDFERACVRLEELRNDLSDDFEAVDGSLRDIESFLERSLLAHSDRETLERAETETAAQLREYRSGMEPDVYRSTFDKKVLKRLREDHGLPRLG
jgi:hypothetical protein